MKLEPIDPRGLDAALRLFATTFVIEDKQQQVYKRLLTGERRVETLASLARWIRTRTSPLEGADRSPAGLRARFGELLGIVVGERTANRTTIVGALDLGRNLPSLFIADSGSLAMITASDGPPVLCSRL